MTRKETLKYWSRLWTEMRGSTLTSSIKVNRSKSSKRHLGLRSMMKTKYKKREGNPVILAENNHKE